MHFWVTTCTHVNHLASSLDVCTMIGLYALNAHCDMTDCIGFLPFCHAWITDIVCAGHV